MSPTSPSPLPLGGGISPIESSASKEAQISIPSGQPQEIAPTGTNDIVGAIVVQEFPLSCTSSIFSSPSQRALSYTQGQPQGIAPTSLFVGAIPCGCPLMRLRIKRN